MLHYEILSDGDDFAEGHDAFCQETGFHLLLTIGPSVLRPGAASRGHWVGYSDGGNVDAFSHIRLILAGVFVRR